MKDEKELWDYIRSVEIKTKTNTKVVRRSKNEDVKEVDLDYLFNDIKLK